MLTSNEIVVKCESLLISQTPSSFILKLGMELYIRPEQATHHSGNGGRSDVSTSQPRKWTLVGKTHEQAQTSR